MTELFNHWASSAFLWLWAWLEVLSYWIASIGGCSSWLLYVATHEEKFKNFTVVMFIVYVIIRAAGTVI
jgi:hypothetical protein